MATHLYAFDELNRAYYELKHKPEGYIKELCGSQRRNGYGVVLRGGPLRRCQR